MVWRRAERPSIAQAVMFDRESSDEVDGKKRWNVRFRQCTEDDIILRFNGPAEILKWYIRLQYTGTLLYMNCLLHQHHVLL